MRAVPVFPRGMTLVKARDQGLLSGEPLDFSSNCGHIRKATNSKMFARVLPYKLFPTVITKLAVGDGMNGQCMHWDQHRVLTVMEAKRAQGYLDHEVLVGSATQQMKIVGNSVDRKAALVLGLSLRESWLKSDFTSLDVDDPATGRMIMAQNNAYVDSTEVDIGQNQNETRLDSVELDNRAVKLSLILSREEIKHVDEVTANSGRTTKELLRFLSKQQEHRTARQLIHGVADEA